LLAVKYKLHKNHNRISVAGYIWVYDGLLIEDAVLWRMPDYQVLAGVCTAAKNKKRLHSAGGGETVQASNIVQGVGYQGCQHSTDMNALNDKKYPIQGFYK